MQSWCPCCCCLCCGVGPCRSRQGMGLEYSNCKLYTYWYRHGDNTVSAVATNNLNKPLKRETQDRFLLADPKTNNCSLSIRNVRKTDAGTYVFRVERGYDVKYTYRDKKLTLRVTELTQKPDILIVEPLKSGHPTELTCSLPGSCQGGSAVTFSWVGAAVVSLNHWELHSSVLTFTPRPQDHGTNLTCQVKHQWSLVTTERTIWLNVFLKNHRRQAAGRRKVTNDEDPVLSTATWGSQQNPRTHGPSDQESPTGDTSAEGEEQDTQYANLRFHGRKKREPQDREATSTCLYSEIKKRSQ